VVAHRSHRTDFGDEHLSRIDSVAYELETDWRPVRVELSAAGSRRVDLHPVVIGRVNGRAVGSLSAEQQLRFRTGYQLRDVDRHDLSLLATMKPLQRRN
jgi:lincosamide nucleotidyltransferase A/C/D/E